MQPHWRRETWAAAWVVLAHRRWSWEAAVEAAPAGPHLVGHNDAHGAVGWVVAVGQVDGHLRVWEMNRPWPWHNKEVGQFSSICRSAGQATTNPTGTFPPTVFGVSPKPDWEPGPV